MTPKKLFILVTGGVTLVLTLAFSSSLIEVNDAGYMQIKQSITTGKLTCHTQSGPYFQGLGKITTYPQATTLYFGVNDNNNASDAVLTPSLDTTFSDNAKSQVFGSVRVTLPEDCESLKKIHHKFKSIHGVMNKLLLPALRDVAFKTGPHMTSGESIAERRAEFSDLFRDQLLYGVIRTNRLPTKVKNLMGEEVDGFVQEKVTCSKGEDCISGFLRSPSAVEQYQVNLAQFEIADIEYKPEVLAQIEAQRKARMDILTVEAEAQKADARAKKAEAEERAKVAETRAAEEVQKTQRIVRAEADKAESVLQAEKKMEVAKLAKEAAEYTKKQSILLGEGEATRKRLVMNADGALEKKLNAYIEAQKVWAAAYSNRKVPHTVFGGDSSGGGYSDGGTKAFMNMLTLSAAKDLAVDVRPK